MSYDVRVDPGVSEDLKTLGSEQQDVPEGWRLSPEEVEATSDRAIRLIESLREDPYQGDVLRGQTTQRVLQGCRRLRFDPERRVAEMASEGVMNREIAEALFVTLPTIEAHLRHAYKKLAISSRDELPAALSAPRE